MSFPVPIAGKTVEIAWTQDIARRYPYRASLIGGVPTIKQLGNTKTAAAAITRLLWLFLPPAVHANYQTPEDLFLDLDHEAHSSEIGEAVLGVVAEMVPDAEKKSTSMKSPSPGSNSG